VGKAGYSFSPPSRDVSVQYYAPLATGPSGSSIKEVLGLDPSASVAATFTALHEFIAGDGLTDNPGTIKLGDWIDLDTLTVTAYNGEGSISGTSGRLRPRFLCPIGYLSSPPVSSWGGFANIPPKAARETLSVLFVIQATRRAPEHGFTNIQDIGGAQDRTRNIERVVCLPSGTAGP
jgi:hypothetical protein